MARRKTTWFALATLLAGVTASGGEAQTARWALDVRGAALRQPSCTSRRTLRYQHPGFWALSTLIDIWL